VVKGKTAQGPFERRIKLEEAKSSPDNAALRFLWARQRLMGLVDFSNFDRGNKDLEKQVIALGLKYSLMSPFTSFVAVDKVKRADGRLVTVKQPLPLPEGVSDLAVGSGGAIKMGMMPSMMPPSPSGMLAREGSVGFMGGGRKPKAGPHAGGTGTAEPAVLKVTVSVKDVKVKGGLTPAAVRQALEGEVAKLTQCCQDAAKAGLKLPAELTVTFKIGLDGKITGSANITPKATLQSLKDCLAAALKGIQFPQPQKAAVAVTVTLSLSGN